MTTPRDADRLLAAYLADGIEILPDRVADAVLDEVHRTRQRAVFGPRRTPFMNSTFRMAIGGGRQSSPSPWPASTCCLVSPDPADRL